MHYLSQLIEKRKHVKKIKLDQRRKDLRKEKQNENINLTKMEFRFDFMKLKLLKLQSICSQVQDFKIKKNDGNCNL